MSERLWHARRYKKHEEEAASVYIVELGAGAARMQIEIRSVREDLIYRMLCPTNRYLFTVEEGRSVLFCDGNRILVQRETKNGWKFFQFTENADKILLKPLTVQKAPFRRMLDLA